MGNRLCGNGKTAYDGKPRLGEPGWNPKKDTHLLRLWAEVFRVQDNEFGWERVSDDVVPINITCLEDGSSRAFQITAYSRNALKLFDARIIHPGTPLYQANECFVHWKDLLHNCEWGLNFTAPIDARRFQDCCSPPAAAGTSQRLYKKSSSSNSLRASPSRQQRSPRGYTPAPTQDDAATLQATAMPAHTSNLSRRTNSQPDSLLQQQQQQQHQQHQHQHHDHYDKCTCSSGSMTHSHTAPATEPAAKRRVFAQARSCSEDERQLLQRQQQQHYASGSSSMRSRAKETSVDEVMGASADQDWPAPPPQQQLQLASPDMAVDTQTLSKLLNVFPTVSSSPTPSTSFQQHQQQQQQLRPSLHRSLGDGLHYQQQQQQQMQYLQQQQQHFNQTYAAGTLPNSPQLSEQQQQQQQQHSCKQQRQHRRSTPRLTDAAAAAADHCSSVSPAAVRAGSNDSAGESRGRSRSRSRSRQNEAWNSDSDAESVSSVNSSIGTMQSETQASASRQAGAIRISGWLSVKNWLVHKKRKIEPATHRKWRQYWVCLKGTVLMFYKSDAALAENGERQQPRHSLIIEGCIAQALPEHPKKENVLTLSTAFGDAYLLQAADKAELDNWITAFHSACASLFARQHGKSDTVRLLKTEIAKLDCSIDLDSKMKMMAELQLSAVTDPRSRQTIQRDIQQWEENLERLLIELYRYRCYMASLIGGELPNPKNILANVSKSSKLTLSKLGIFNLTSFHALVCARAPLTTATLHYRAQMQRKDSAAAAAAASAASAAAAAASAGEVTGQVNGHARQQSMQQRPLQQQQQQQQHHRAKSEIATAAAVMQQQQQQNSQRTGSSYVTDPTATTSSSEQSSSLGCRQFEQGRAENWIGIRLPAGGTLTACVQEGMTVQEILELICREGGLDPRTHYIRLRLSDHGIDIIPDSYTVFENQEFQLAELCEKQTHRCLLHKRPGCRHYGMTVEAELCEDSEREDDLCVFIAEVDRGSAAEEAGLMIGDEIVMVNDRMVSKLDMVYIEDLFEKSSSLNLIVRSCRQQQPQQQQQQPQSRLESPPPPPPPPPLSVEEAEKLQKPALPPKPAKQQQQQQQQQQVQAQLHSSAYYVRKVEPVEQQPAAAAAAGASKIELINYRHSNSSESSHTSSQSSQSKLPPHERLRRCIFELVETERSYVENLRTLLQVYMLPLQRAIFPQRQEVQQLADTTENMLQFQIQFLHSLEEAVRLEPELNRFTDASQFKKILFILSGSFLYYAEHFKLYSSFCAYHSKCQKLLNLEENDALRDFLLMQNPHQEQSVSIDSYLIKPIQRILKYPLLLQGLCSNSVPGSEEHRQLLEAMKGMETVAGHINEMQKIYEEFGAIFEELMRIFKEVHSNKRPVELGIGDLQMYGSVEWLNASDNLGKIKKNIDLYTTCFVFRSAVVLLCRERARNRRKGSKANINPVAAAAAAAAANDLVRFQTVIPVPEVEVRCGFTSEKDSMNLWELVHMRSDADRRSEKIYQLSNCSTDARTDFLKTIRQMIRLSVRQMSLPSLRCSTPSASDAGSDGGGGQQQQQLLRRRPQPPQRTTSQMTTSTTSAVAVAATAGSAQYRHSGHFAAPVESPTASGSVPAAMEAGCEQLKARSKTCSDLEQVGAWRQQQQQLQQVEKPMGQNSYQQQQQEQQEQHEQQYQQQQHQHRDGSSECDNASSSPAVTAANTASSCSTLNTVNSADTSRSAKLLFASGTPLKHPTASALAGSSAAAAAAAGGEYGASPIWKPRSRVTYDVEGANREADKCMSASTAYSDYTGLNAGMLPVHHQTLCEFGDESAAAAGGGVEEGITQL